MLFTSLSLCLTVNHPILISLCCTSQTNFYVKQINGLAHRIVDMLMTIPR